MNTRHPKNSEIKRRFVFLTLPDYSFIALSSAIETLRMANRVLQQELYEWTIASMEGLPVVASNGLSLTPTLAMREVGLADIVFVCGGVNIEQAVTPEVVTVLRRVAVQQAALGSLCTGAYALAKAGLLDQCKAAIHWENKFSAQELFPKVMFSDKLFVIDKKRYTCAGGTSSLDLMLNLIKEQHGIATAALISEHFTLGRIRDDQECQYTPMSARVGFFQANLVEIAALMAANLEEPLSMNEIAALVGISRRQLERLFQRHVGETPTKYYMNLRLRRARELLLQTAMPVTEVAIVCGFVSAAYFSRCFREVFGCSPSAERVNHKGHGKPVTVSNPQIDETHCIVEWADADRGLILTRSDAEFKMNCFTQLNSNQFVYAHA